MGRSRGGLTTKLHAACSDEHTAVAVLLTEGQRHDSVPFAEVIEQASDSGEVVSVTADKAYDGEPIRAPLAEAGIQAIIPSPSHRKVAADCPKHLYRMRHRIENWFRKLFDFRRVATRYDKLANCFLAFVHLVGVIVLLRSLR